MLAHTSSRTLVRLLLLGSLACVVPTVERPDTPAPEPIAPGFFEAGAAMPPPGSAAPLSVRIDPCWAADCELRFRFSLPMVEADAVLEAQPPRVEFDPPLAGKFRWDSPAELVFTPAAGGLLWGHTVRASLDHVMPLAGPDLALGHWSQSVSVPPFQAAGKVAEWPVVAGQPRLVDVLDAHSGMIGRGPLFLLFDQPVSPNTAARIALEDAAGRRLRARIRQPRNADPVWGGSAPLENLVTVTLVDRPAIGASVTLRLPTPATADAGNQPRTLTVAGPLLVTLAEAPDPHRAPLHARWMLRFSNPVRVEKLQAALSLEPAVPFELSGWGDRDVAVRATLQPGVRYRLSIRPGFTDILGNRLEKPLDARFHAQDLPPSLELPRQALLLERASARLPVRTRNLGHLGARIFFLDIPTFVAALSHPAPASCESLGGRLGRPRLGPADASPLNQVVTQEIAVRTTSRGLVCAEISGSGRGTEAEGEFHQSVLAQISGLGSTVKVFSGGALVWVTRLADASPARHATVTLLDGRGGKLGTGRAGEDGVAIVKAGDLPETYYVVAETADDIAVTEVSEGRLSQAFQFGIPGKVNGPEPLAAAVFSDRGVYRPGEKVHVKAIVRDPEATPIRVVVQDPRGQHVIDQPLPLDSFGAASLEVELQPQAPVGEYSLRVAQGERNVTRHFRVEEYRVPTFEVSLKTDEAEWKRGEVVHAAVEARYLHGGMLEGREVRWQVVREREGFAPAGFPRFVFAAPDAGEVAGQVAGAEARLDGAGRLALSFKADHAPSAGPMRYTIEASVTDVDRQAYAGRISRVVHPAAFYVGVLPPARTVLAAGDTPEVPVAVVSPAGTAQEGVTVHLRLERLDYHTAARWSASGAVQLMNRPVTAEASGCTVVSEQAPVRCRFGLSEAGQFRLVAEAEDSSGQRVSAEFQLSVAGATTAAWPRFDQDRIELVADRASYQPGEVATLVVKTPFAGARGLLTVERDGILEHRLFSIDGDTPKLEVPIGAGDAPNVFASVVLLRGRAHFERDASGFETGAPAFKMGYVSLNVRPSAQALAVAIRADSVRAPRGELAVELEVHDDAGAPVAGQVTLMLVDEAVLGLTRQRTPDPLAELYPPQPLGVRTAESRLEMPHAHRARHEQVFPGGDGGEGFGLDHSPAELRNLFQSTAYWNPDVRTGGDGRARVLVELPDNLTSYRIMAVVADGQGRAGSADRKILVRKPLMVQAVLPRFAYPADRLGVEALVVNGTEHEGKVRIRATFEGMALDEGAQAEQESQVRAGGTVTFRFPVRVTSRKQVIVRYRVELGSEADAVEVKLPVLNPGSMRTIVGERDDTVGDRMSLALPADREPGTAGIEVLVSGSSLTSLKGAVDYLMGYPNGCIEQTTSTAYPLVVLPDLLPDMGITVNQDDLKKFSEAGVKRILSFQTTEGGLAYWPGSNQSHAFGTAFGLTALIEAKKRGYQVPDVSLARMADYLEAALKRGDITEEIPHGSIPDGDTRAFFVMTLGRLGRPQPAYVDALWRQKQKLTPFGLSFLAVAIAESKGDHSLLQPILAEIRAKSTQAPDETWFEGAPAGGWSMGSPLRTHAAALLAYAEAARGSDATGKLLTGLLRRQTGGSWGNTQENVFGIMGVVALAKAAGVAGEGPSFDLAIDGRPVRPEQMERVSSHVLRLTLDEAALGLRPGQAQKLSVQLVPRGGSPLFLTVRASYQAVLDESNRAPRSAGFEIARHYESLAGESLDGKPVPLGAVVRIRLSLTAQQKQNYVAIGDRLPAGLEPMNAALATTETDSLGQVSAIAERSLQALSYSEVRDARVAFFVDEMPAGEYEYVYLARATTPGRFLRPASAVEAMYRPGVEGTTAIDEVTVE